PCLATPRPALPCRARPALRGCRGIEPRMTTIHPTYCWLPCPAMPCQALPRLARPCRASPRPAKPGRVLLVRHTLGPQVVRHLGTLHQVVVKVFFGQLSETGYP